MIIKITKGFFVTTLSYVLPTDIYLHCQVDAVKSAGNLWCSSCRRHRPALPSLSTGLEAFGVFQHHAGGHH